jgi:hypothetical protein
MPMSSPHRRTFRKNDTSKQSSAALTPSDERLKKVSLATSPLQRPERGALAGRLPAFPGGEPEPMPMQPIGFVGVILEAEGNGMKHLQIGTHVKWRWGAHWAHGRIEQVFTARITRTIRGTEVTRNASPEAPAYLITQPRGGVVLKNCNEITEE